jgi:hypothetical protein
LSLKAEEPVLPDASAPALRVAAERMLAMVVDQLVTSEN